MTYKALKLDLTEKQVMQALKGKPIRITPSQINTGSTFVSLHPANARKVEKAFLTKKGLTLSLSHGELAETAQRMGGSGFWNSAWNWLKNNWKVLKPIASAAVDVATPFVSTITGQPAIVGEARKLLKQTTGVGIDRRQAAVVAQKEESSRKRLTKNDKYEMLRGAGIYLS